MDEILRGRDAAVLFIFLLSSCTQPSGGPRALPSSESRPSSTPAPPPPPPRVELRNGAKPGALEIVVTGSFELDAELMVEREIKSGGFEPVKNLDLGSMKLVSSCDQTIGKCVKIEDAVLRPVPWSGMSCSAQCNGSCDKNVQRSGRHRFVVRTCDGKTRFEGPVFEMPK